MAKLVVKKKVVKKVAAKKVAEETPKKVAKAVEKKATKVVPAKAPKVSNGWRVVDKRWEKKDTKEHQQFKDGKCILKGVVLENGNIKVYSSYAVKEFKGMKEYKSTNASEPLPFYYTVSGEVFNTILPQE